jgi:general secretion pathway protein A
MEPLKPPEIRPYLAHRMAVAGAKFEDIFEEGVEAPFYQFSVGCPRLISLLADRVLLAAYAKGLKPIGADFVEQKAKGMDAIRQASLPSSAESGVDHG